VFIGVVRALFAEGSMPEGAILDVGAHRGTASCLYATFAPDRLVHAMDPSTQNIDHINSTYSRDFPNIRTHVGALGREYKPHVHADLPPWGMINLNEGAARPAAQTAPTTAIEFTIFRLDDIFAHERLGFAHIDVEGSELDVLLGATRTVARDLPIFSVEIHASDKEAAAALLQHVHGLGYRMMLIHEICGSHLSCRNILCLPPSLDVRSMPAFELALASKRVVPLQPPFEGDNSSILRHVSTSTLLRDHTLQIDMHFQEKRNDGKPSKREEAAVAKASEHQAHKRHDGTPSKGAA
jgi:FkbM family methyltransferase